MMGSGLLLQGPGERTPQPGFHRILCFGKQANPRARHIQKCKQHVTVRHCYDCHLGERSEEEVTNPLRVRS